MAFIGVALAWMLTLTSSSGKDVGHQMHSEPWTKYVNGVPIHNYQFALDGKKKGTKEAQNCSTWLITAHEESVHLMRDACASTSLGKRHCSEHVPQSIPTFVFKGSEDELSMLLETHSHLIEYVEPDFELSIPEAQSGDGEVPEFRGIEQSDPEWGLDRIDERNGVTGSYKPGLDGGHGYGVHVYVLDTGIMTTHADLQGRAIPKFDATSGHMVLCDEEDVSCALDHQGHGTHCAGIIGGHKYGVAKDVKMYAGKVLSDRGSGSYSWMLQAFDWLVDNKEMPAVVSMSLGGMGNSESIKRGVDAVTSAGITVVIAAGNSAADACAFQPAFVPSAITVGASEEPHIYGFPPLSWAIDPMAPYSNYGTCLDIWAPGSDITSCGISHNNASATMSGTSMACPAVSGAAALVLGIYPWTTPADMESLLQTWATYGSIITLFSPGGLLYVGEKWGGTNTSASQQLLGFHRKSALHWLLLVPIGIFVVIGIFAGARRQKSVAAGEVKMRPLLG